MEVNSYNKKANQYYREGNYEQAIEYYKKALNIRIEELGEDHIDTASLYEKIGMAYQEQCHYQEALVHYNKALEIKKEAGHQVDYTQVDALMDKLINKVVEGNDPADTAGYYDATALEYKGQGRYERALEYYQKALELKEELYGENHDEVATSYFIIASTIYAEQYDKALEYYNKALEIKKELYGESDARIANYYHTIASYVFEPQYMYDKALEYHNKALEIRKEQYGEGDTRIAESYLAISGVYKKQNKYQEALEYLCKALDIDKEEYGEFDSEIATDYSLISEVYKLQGKYDEALECQSKALRIINELYLEEDQGIDTHEVIDSYIKTALIYELKLEYNKALEHYNKALEISGVSSQDKLALHEKVDNITKLLERSGQTSCKPGEGSDNNGSDDDDTSYDDSYTSKHGKLGKVRASEPTSSANENNKQEARATDSEVPPSKSALLSVVEEIESHCALIHDERLKAQLEHYAKTGVVYDTLAPYVEAAAAAHPTLFRDDTTQGDFREEPQGIVDGTTYANQELLDKVIGMLEHRGGVTFDEKLIAQLHHYAYTGETPETLAAYLNFEQVEEQEHFTFGEQINTTTYIQGEDALMQELAISTTLLSWPS